MRIPDFEVDVSSWCNTNICWTDGERRYHFWLGKDGKPSDEVLHSNPVARTLGLNDHRALKQTAKKWAPTIAAIMAKVEGDGLLLKAQAVATKKREKDETDRLRKIEMERLLKLTAALVKLPPAVRTAIEMLPPTVRIDFVIEMER